MDCEPTREREGGRFEGGKIEEEEEEEEEEAAAKAMTDGGRRESLLVDPSGGSGPMLLERMPVLLSRWTCTADGVAVTLPLVLLLTAPPPALWLCNDRAVGVSK
jgi:hypothetical protein